MISRHPSVCQRIVKRLEKLGVEKIVTSEGISMSDYISSIQVKGKEIREI